MAHCCVSVHPCSLSHRVDYSLNWPPTRLSLPHLFIFFDIYWSLSEKFPSSHPFPKVELQGKKKLMAHVCMWFINDLKPTFVFPFFCYVTMQVFCFSSINLLLWFKSFFFQSECHLSLVLFIVFFHSRPTVQSFEPVLWRCVQELPHESTSRQPVRFHPHKSLVACSESWDVTCDGRLSLTGKQHKPCSPFCLDKRDSRFKNLNMLKITIHTHNPFKFVIPTYKLPKQGFAFKTDCITGAS